MAGAFAELLEVLQLRAAVAVAERMHIVDIANDPGGLAGESRWLTALEVLFRHDTPMHVGHAGFDISAELELVPVPGYLDGSNLAGPRVHILEQMPMNGLQVFKVKIPGRGAGGYPVGNETALCTLERLWIANV